MLLHKKGKNIIIFLDFVPQKFINLSTMIKGVKDFRSMHKIVYIVKHVQLKWLMNISNGKHLKEMVGLNSKFLFYFSNLM
jgi:hypothetical protein